MTETNPDCHYGDHDYLPNGRCKWCDNSNSAILQEGAWEKAERVGLTHGDHFHRTKDTKESCHWRTGDEENTH